MTLPTRVFAKNATISPLKLEELATFLRQESRLSPHGDEGLPLALADLINGADVGMVEDGSSAGFARKHSSDWVTCQVFGEELRSNVAAEAEVRGLIHHTHPAAAQLCNDEEALGESHFFR